jgi:pyrimidine oxygenase
LIEANGKAGRDFGALLLQMVIADETDAAAMAKWEHYKVGIDLEAIAYRDAGAGPFEQGPALAVAAAQDARRAQAADKPGRFCLLCVGAANARLDGNGAGARGVMLTFDDFSIGMEQFGQRIRQLMKPRAMALCGLSGAG